MANLMSLMDWHIYMLASPLVFGIALFGILLWCDRRYERQIKEKLGETITNSK